MVIDEAVDNKLTVYSKLQKEGPQYIEKKISTNFRQRGVTKFKPTSASRGTSVKGAGRTTPVYYIIGEHDKKEIIKEWLKLNEQKLQDTPDWALHQRISSYGDEFKEASAEILGPFKSQKGNNGVGNGNGEHMGGECPLCGGEFKRSLRDHLPCE